jgi:hypothetical protein
MMISQCLLATMATNDKVFHNMLPVVLKGIRDESLDIIKCSCLPHCRHKVSEWEVTHFDTRIQMALEKE